MSWGVKFLTNNPQVQIKLRDELSNNMKDSSNPTFQELNDDRSFAYMHAVTYEILRLANVAGATTRMTTEDTYLAGYLIPKNTSVFLPLGYLSSRSTFQRDQPKRDWLESEGRMPPSKVEGRRAWWDERDVDEFKPERWIQSCGRFDPCSGPFFPFGLGPRGCFGVKLAVSLCFHSPSYSILIFKRSLLSKSLTSFLFKSRLSCDTC